MQHVGMDMFDYGGRQYVVLVDQWSGYLLFKQVPVTTSSNVVKIVTDWFNILGWPASIRTDGGPQFMGEFRSFCSDKNIRHEISAPYNPRANGLAESGVKIVKDLLKKATDTNQDPQHLLYLYRNIPKTHGYSLAQPIDFKQAQIDRDNHFLSTADHYNRDKRELSKLSVGQEALVQDPKTGFWETKAVITAIRSS
jgi:transposase InsO family protein